MVNMCAKNDHDEDACYCLLTCVHSQTDGITECNITLSQMQYIVPGKKDKNIIPFNEGKNFTICFLSYLACHR